MQKTRIIRLSGISVTWQLTTFFYCPPPMDNWLKYSILNLSPALRHQCVSGAISVCVACRLFRPAQTSVSSRHTYPRIYSASLISRRSLRVTTSLEWKPCFEAPAFPKANRKTQFFCVSAATRHDVPVRSSMWPGSLRVILTPPSPSASHSPCVSRLYPS